MKCSVLIDTCDACGRLYAGGATCGYCDAWHETIANMQYEFSHGRPGVAWTYDYILQYLLRAVTIESVAQRLK